MTYYIIRLKMHKRARNARELSIKWTAQPQWLEVLAPFDARTDKAVEAAEGRLTRQPGSIAFSWGART